MIYLFKENRYCYRTGPNGQKIDEIRYLQSLAPQRSRTLVILAIPEEITAEIFCSENLPK